MVAPVSIKYAKFGFIGIAAFGCKISHHLHEIVTVHGESRLLAVCGGVSGRDFAESRKSLHRKGMGAFRQCENIKILPSGFDRIYQITGDSIHLLLCDALVKYVQTRREYIHVGIGTYKAHAFTRSRRSLVKLARQCLHSQMRIPVDIYRVRHAICSDLAEYAVAGLFEKAVGKTEDIIDTDKSKIFDIKAESRIEFMTETFGLYSELRTFLNKNTMSSHGLVQISVSRILRACSARKSRNF